MARILRLNEAFTDATLPVLRDDPILNSGSLVLNEPNHPANPMASGVPASGTAVPNIAWKEAAALLGSGSQSSLASTLTYNGISSTANTLGKIERSTKGGLHGIITQSAWTSGNLNMQVGLPAAVVTYMAANPTKVFFVSMWGKFTRSPRSDMSGALALAQLARYNSGIYGAYYLAVLNTQLAPNSGNRTGLRTEGIGSSLAADSDKFLINIAGVNNDTANQTYSDPFGRTVASWGSNFLSNGSGYDNKWPSWVWYRTYIEDLTASAAAAGKTVAAQYAAQDAIDKALYDKHVGISPAAGVVSRYYGDTTPTAPSTIA